MSLFTPDVGLVFWTSFSFAIVLLVLARWGFPVILHAVEERRATISASLDAAAAARQEVESCREERAKIERQTLDERVHILSEARVFRQRIIAQAQAEATAEAARILAEARREIERERRDVRAELQRQAVRLAHDISNKALGAELENPAAQAQFIDRITHE